MPELTGRVVDTAGKLSPEDKSISRILVARENTSTGAQIAVLISGSLDGEDIDDVAYKTFNAWKLGQKGADNGVLLVIAPSERKVRIETGKGVGDKITDLQSNDIIRHDIGPELKQDHFREAVAEGTMSIARALGAKDLPPPRRPRRVARERDSNLGVFIVIPFVILFLILSFISRRRGGGGGGFWGGGFGGGGFGGGDGGGFGGGGDGGFSGGRRLVRRRRLERQLLKAHTTTPTSESSDFAGGGT